MSLVDSALKVGGFLLEHADIIEDVVDALSSGTPKDVIKAAIRHAQKKVSEDALREELEAAEERKKNGASGAV